MLNDVRQQQSIINFYHWIHKSCPFTLPGTKSDVNSILMRLSTGIHVFACHLVHKHHPQKIQTSRQRAMGPRANFIHPKPDKKRLELMRLPGLQAVPVVKKCVNEKGKIYYAVFLPFDARIICPWCFKVSGLYLFFCLVVYTMQLTNLNYIFRKMRSRHILRTPSVPGCARKHRIGKCRCQDPGRKPKISCP